jgi:hypothetical protein
MGEQKCSRLGTRERINMPDYRIYTLRDDGHISSPADVIKCPDDQTALEEAKLVLNGKVIEVWDGARPVARLDPPRK